MVFPQKKKKETYKYSFFTSIDLFFFLRYLKKKKKKDQFFFRYFGCIPEFIKTPNFMTSCNT